MPRLYGRNYTRLELQERTGLLSQLAGVRLVTLADGLERGIRSLQFRTGSGLAFTVLVDRAFDIADCSFRGTAIGWHSPTGFRHPGLHEYNDEGGLSWLRSFSGLMVTCGLDHTLFMDSDDASHYHYNPRRSVESSLHGRVANIPARLIGYGEAWEDDQCVLWAEGEITQAAVFGENLHLIRRIEANVGGNEIRLFDRVINRGFYRTPHMFLYHINLGFPVLDHNSEFLAPIRETIWAGHAEHLSDQAVGYRVQSKPRVNFHEQVYEHAMASDDHGVIPVALVNPQFQNGQGLGVLIEVRENEFPYQFQWQNYQKGLYAMGIEPSTNHVLGKPFAKQRGELIWLEHDEQRAYTTRFAILDGNADIEPVRRRIEAICRQPHVEFPEVTGNWR